MDCRVEARDRCYNYEGVQQLARAHVDIRNGSRRHIRANLAGVRWRADTNTIAAVDVLSLDNNGTDLRMP
jgi:hypothetical protein